VIAVSQLPLVLGFEIGGGTTLKQFIEVCSNLDKTHSLTLAIGVFCTAIIIFLKRFYPALPGQIIVLVGAILIVHIYSLQDYGVIVVGEIPQGLPAFHIPFVSLKDIQTLIPVAFAAAIVAFSDTMANSRGFADRNHYRVDADQELLALGTSNIFAGVTQSLPVSGSGSRTSVAEAAGSKTQVTSVFAATTVALTLLFFNDLLYALPMSALGGVLLAAAWNLIDIKSFIRMWEYRGVGLISALMTMIGVVSFGIIQGIGIGVLFSLVLVVRAVAFPTDTTLGKTKDQRFRDEREFPEAETVPGIIVYRFSGVLIFANSGTFRNRADELISSSHEHIKGFVLDASGIIEIDMSACEMLSLFHKELEGRGIRLIITKLRKDIRHSLIKGWLGPIDKNRLFKKNVREAVASIQGV
jgi:MFS superfamily sulfate permease-like transporter